MFKPVFQAVQMFLKGASGRDRHDKHQLSEHLLALQVAYDQQQQQQDALQKQNSRLQRECDRLQTAHSQVEKERDRLKNAHKDLAQRLKSNKVELEEYINIADIDTKSLEQENRELQNRLRQSEDEKETLQGTNVSLRCDLAVLKNQLNILNYQIADGALQTDVVTESSLLTTLSYDVNLGEIDLSDVSLALVGGHETTYRKVTEELENYGLKTCVHVPPRSIASASRHKIKDKISNCDLIVTVTSHVDHSVSECVKQLKDAQVLAGECIRVSCHGKSGLVREVLNYFADPMRSSEMA
ncbi:MAG: DUF2325 domain-containing protein [Cyanobacteria bacterium P01_C01_bin.69]